MLLFPNDEIFIKRCVDAEFQEEKEFRTYNSDPAFSNILTPLNSGEYTSAINVGKKMLTSLTDFDLIYKWVGSAYRSINQLQNSREILMKGLTEAKRKCLLLTEMAETEWQSDNIEAAIYYLSQALHCLSVNMIDYNAYLLLSYIAKGLDLQDFENTLLSRVDTLRGGQIRLDSQSAERLTNLVRNKKTEAMKNVLLWLQEKYFFREKNTLNNKDKILKTFNTQTPQQTIEPSTSRKKGGALTLLIAGSLFAFIGLIDLLAYFTDASSSARYPVIYAILLAIGMGGIILGVLINTHSRVKGTTITDKAESIREKKRNPVSNKQAFADIDQVVDEPSGSTKLHIACSSGNVNEVRNLLDQGAAVNATNKWDATPLDLAYSNGSGQHHQIYDEIVSLLKAKGGKTNKWNGMTL